jgi:hypothetical protein
MAARWIRFVSFWTLFALLFSLPNLSMRIENKRWMDFYNLPLDSVDVVFMGNSHSYVAFQPRIIDEIIPVSSYVVGTGGENIVLTYYELKELLKTQHPKVVVLETFALDLNDAYMPTQNYYGFLDAGKWSANKAAIALHYLRPQTVYTIFPALRTRMNWEKPYDYLDQLIGEIGYFKSPTRDPGLGSEPIPVVITESDYLAAQVTTVDQYDSPSAEIQLYLDKFYQLCEENDIQLILTTVPVVNEPQTTTGRYAPYDVVDFASDHNLPLVKFDQAMFTDLHFAQPDHVNGFGSVIVSVQMAEKIAEVLHLAIAADKLQYYQSFMFSKYDLSSSQNVYNVELFQTEQTNSLEYKWTVTGDGGTVYKSGWQASNACQFILAADGAYKVSVEIMNPAGEYRMSAVFLLEKRD